MQKDYDKAYGFNAFPYTHGDDVERAHEEATKAWRAELIDELEKKGAINTGRGQYESAKKAEAVSELEGKAKNMTEARQNEHMLGLQTESQVLRNQMQPDKVAFKNEKQEALLNKFVQETPFYAKRHKATILRPAVQDSKNIESVVRDARKRFEMELLRTKQREVEDEKELKALEEENNRFDMAVDIKRRQEKQAIREIMLEQMEMDRMRKVYDRDEITAPCETHFGPQEDQVVTQALLNRKREMQNHLQSELKHQIDGNQQNQKRQLQMEKLRDSVNMGTVNSKLAAERSEIGQNKQKQK